MEHLFKQDKLSEQIIGCAIEVHRTLGPGLLESVYADCLAMELEAGGLRFERQVKASIVYKGRPLAQRFYIDYLVEGLYVVELKAVDKILPVHSAQVLTYMKLANHPFGLLLNFKCVGLIDGIRRLENHAALPP